MWNIKYDFKFEYNDLLFFENAKSIFIARNSKSATKNPMLIKFLYMLSVTVADVCAKD